MTRSETPTPLLHVLIIEDVEDDALLLADSLQAGGLTFDWEYVDSEAALTAALQSPWDIIFSDFSMPNFSGTRALELVRRHDPDIPFIFVSGTIGEATAVEAMKRGAQDFVMKGQLARLLPSVERELRDARTRRERRQAEAARNRLAAVLEATPDLVAIHAPDGRLRYLNGAGRRLLGLDTQQQIEGRSMQDIFPEDMAQQLLVDVIPYVREHHSWSGETVLQIAEGDELPVSLVVLARHNPQGELEDLSIIARDISERKRFEAELQHRATHDALTSLPNRYFLIDRMTSALERARRHDSCVAVLFLDLDNFKRINDTLGHAAGDTLLQQVAQRLTSCLRPNDTVARHGGDEFTIMVDDLSGVDNTVLVLSKLHAAFESPVNIGLHKVYVTFSTGIALYPHDGESVEDLLRHADTAMYQSKSSGLNQYRFYAPRMNARGHEYLAMESDLRQALAQEQFRLHCQPQVSLRSGQIVGIEGLIRWQHPRRGLVSPADFVPLLETSGLIIPVGEWVLRQACRLHRQWREAGFDGPRISINVSAIQFNDRDLLDKVRRALEEEQMPAGKLELEITENMVMRDPPGAAEILKALHTLGVRTAIDDFGTGYSSLAYLKRFPVDVLKIDQTFVADLGRDLGDEAIVEASISLARKLGLEIVAEGVETLEQLEFLRACDCDLVQGYYLSKPVTDAALIGLLPKVWHW
ncbi:putative bifunctional diguanylate cyclase/phosphodiesterase [Sedimenticola hydrogenitrophicus]|uniref:putative bifunctional diguanylate cyclase/phosphodiesterase n=1 Tax=Sedimenticola hydrogenitrophicus TaxID=2967975 RepID=UPI0023B1CF53|nr:EAL domain-containing protein [Sedimenticola hydrogenitrophicus]